MRCGTHQTTRLLVALQHAPLQGISRHLPAPVERPLLSLRAEIEGLDQIADTAAPRVRLGKALQVELLRFPFLLVVYVVSVLLNPVTQLSHDRALLLPYASAAEKDDRRTQSQRRARQHLYYLTLSLSMIINFNIKLNFIINTISTSDITRK